MNIYVHLWQYLAEFFLVWEMFQVNVFIENQNAHFTYRNFLYIY